MRTADGFRWGAVVAVLAIVASKAYTSGKEHGARRWRATALKQNATIKDLQATAERQNATIKDLQATAERALDAAEGWQREYCALAELVADNGLVPGWELPGCCPPSCVVGDLADLPEERPE